MARIGPARGARALLGLAVLLLLAYGLATLLESLASGPRADRFAFHVLFKDVGGLRPGSRVLHRGLVVGEVAELSLDPQAGRVRALLRLDPGAAPLVRSTTQIWTVRPRLGLLTRELSGLDTLVKESYLQFRVRDGGAPLAPGEELLGLERPPADLAGEELEDLGAGDLSAAVLLERNHGLGPGLPVLFRGLPVGEVRAVALLESGEGVRVDFAVYRDFRRFVRDRSRFWAGRPVLRGGVLGGFSVEDLESLFAPALHFDTPPGSEPAADGTLFTGLAAPPEPHREWTGAPGGTAAALDPGRRVPSPAGPLSPWVVVRYRAVDKNTLRRNDVLQAEGQGVLYRDPGGEYRVLTGRSACDGSFLKRPGFLDRLRIAEESARVLLADGRILPASRIWVDPQGDLALLRLLVPAEAFGAGLPPWSESVDCGVPEAGLPAPPEEPASGVRLLMAGGKAVGLRGREGPGSAAPASISFARLPAALRPGRE